MSTKTFEVEVEVKGRWTLRIRAPDAYAARDLSHCFIGGAGRLSGIIKSTPRPFEIICVSAPVEVPAEVADVSEPRKGQTQRQ